MSNNWNWQQTAQIEASIPSTFGMPACGRDYAISGNAGMAAARLKGHVDLPSARTFAPGSHAWSPPIS